MSHAKPTTDLLSTLKQVSVSEDLINNTIWLEYQQPGRPCVSQSFISECEIAQEVLSQRLAATPEAARPKFQVLRSATEGVFSLGGDLALFAQCVRSGDAERLRQYAYGAIRLMHGNATSYGQSDLTTIALVEGQALGGGFEGVLANQVIVAEEQARFGFPESTFGMFPGMGAYQYLEKRVGAAAAKKMISSSTIYTAAQLYDMGIVDVLVPQGEGKNAVLRYINDQSRRADQKPNDAGIHTVTYDELKNVVDAWVETAMQLDARNLKLMEYLVRAQDSKYQPAASDVCAAQAG